MCDVCQNDTRGVSSRYGSVKRQHGSSGAMMHGVSHARTHGHVKTDNDDVWVRMLGCVSSVEQVTDAGGGLSGHRNTWRWRNLDVSSARCNTNCNSAQLDQKSSCLQFIFQSSPVQLPVHRTGLSNTSLSQFSVERHTANDASSNEEESARIDACAIFSAPTLMRAWQTRLDLSYLFSLSVITYIYE